MKDFHRGGSSGGGWKGGGKKFGGGGKPWERRSGGRDGGDRDGGRPMMHEATCAECGRECQVPFRPTGNRPVYCSNCFKKDEDAGPRMFGRDESRGSSFGEKQMFEAECDKCGAECEVPFRPTGEKPVYCRNCFSGAKSGPMSKPSFSAPSKSSDYGDQFKSLNAKLDSVIAALQALAPSSNVEAVVSKPAKAVKVESEAAPVEKAKKAVPAKKVAAKKPAKGSKK